ncbi:MAG TPA: SGNH/GDSL hydrolase family protein [Acidimicrobiales bacterium]|nr:SGNH/GDSL hydrolase family protein [Acidimicrobiales bacterium]
MRTHRLLVAVCLACSPVLVGCSSGAPDPASSEPQAVATTSAPETGDALDVRIVADSEVPDEVAALLDAEPGIAVSSAVSEHGATMAELDAAADAALAEHPDVLVYAGGTNDLPDGPVAVLAGLDERLRRYGEQACVVVAVPVFRYERGTAAEVQQRTEGTRVLERAVVASGARVASYLDVALAMDQAGEDFFAEGELGDLHPGSRSYPRIAAAIAEQVRACG